jgi:conjugal transfer pilus assembly protein TraL
MDKYHIPQYLDTPFKIILWTWDEVVAFFVPFLTFFWLINSPVTGVLSGVFMVAALKKLKGEEGHYFIAHLAYWHLPPLVTYKATPSSYFREILG